MKKTLILVGLLLASVITAAPAFAACFDYDACLNNRPSWAWSQWWSDIYYRDCIKQVRLVDGPLITIENTSTSTYNVRWNSVCTQSYPLLPTTTIQVPQCIWNTCANAQTQAVLEFQIDGVTKFIYTPYTKLNPPRPWTLKIEEFLGFQWLSGD